MDTESLRIFSAVASELSITHAAAHLGRAPSNVTTRIQQLEADIGAELLVRTGKRLSLSAAGERFLEYATRLLALEDEARQVVTGSEAGGCLRIGSMESTAASRLPEIVAQYHRLYASTYLELSTGPSRRLLEQLGSGRLDCVFVALTPDVEVTALMDDLGLQALPIWKEALRLLLPASESDVQQPEDVRTRSLLAFPLGCSYRSIAEQLLGVATHPAWRIQEMASYHAMIACVAAGSGVTLLPESVLALSAQTTGLHSIGVGHAHTLLVWRKSYAAPALMRLQELLPQGCPSCS